jgi:hypothetical protein
MKHADIEKEIVRRELEIPIYDLKVEGTSRNGWSFCLSKGSYVMEWFTWPNGNVSWLRVRHKEAEGGDNFNQIKKALDFFEKLER